jgi:hypothetical protein
VTDHPNTDPACLVPADEAVLEVVEEPAKPRPSAPPCPHCGGQYRYRRANSGEAGFPLCLACGKDTRELPFDPEASDLLDFVSPGESAALIQEVAERTDFRQAAKLESERCAKMARDLAEFGSRLGRHLACVQRQHARYASRAELLRRYLSDDPASPEPPL